MKSWRTRLALMLTMVAMVLTVSGTALAQHENEDEDENHIDDVEISEAYVNPDDPEEYCVDITIEYEDDTEETFTECEDVE